MPLVTSPGLERKPDRSGLERLAFSQNGFFTAEQARRQGFSHQLLAHHARQGWLERIRRGLYRLTTVPAMSGEEITAAWLTVGPQSVVSHETALELFDLGDVLSNRIHLTVPREERGRRAPPGVVLHTTVNALPPSDVVHRSGIPVTAPHRAIVDAAAAGTQPDIVVDAVVDALGRGLTTESQLRDAAVRSGERVRALIEDAIKARDAR